MHVIFIGRESYQEIRSTPFLQEVSRQGKTFLTHNLSGYSPHFNKPPLQRACDCGFMEKLCLQMNIVRKILVKLRKYNEGNPSHADMNKGVSSRPIMKR